ncbi:MAG: sorbosone dehydrogenase family protein, partial [Cyclobacteriaceae bacterium]
PLEKITLPAGFKIAHYATGVENARSLAMGSEGTVFVSSRKHDEVRALRDTDGDMVADKMWIVAGGLNTPNGVAFREGDLYIAEIDRILKLSDIENNLDNPGEPEVVYDQYPDDTHHGWKYIAFGPDGKLYVPVGAPCNICESDKIYASITRMDPDGSNMEIFAEGIRNSVGFDWNPQTGELWFTDNGRDMLGDNIPPCELNRAPEKGMHFGYPYCHGGTISDPEFGSKYDCSRFTAPAQNLGPHVAPLGMKFYRGSQFPEEYHGNIFIAEHGSWNRSEKIGYRVTMVPVVDNAEANGYEVFAYGWLNEDEQEAWGRPVDILELEDGSFLLSDDKANAVYRIYYEG